MRGDGSSRCGNRPTSTTIPVLMVRPCTLASKSIKMSKALSTLATSVAEFGDKLSPPFPASIVASVDRA